jgi:hypothetical protein
MDTKTALGAAGGIALTIVGATSALLLTVGQGSPPENTGAPAAVVTEYVDQVGNPIDPPLAASVAPEVIITTGDNALVEQTDLMPADSYDEEEEYDEAEYEEDEYEVEEYDEDAEYEEEEEPDHEEVDREETEHDDD